MPCKADKEEFLNVVKKLVSLKINTRKENVPQNNPATATVVNVGVFFLHLNETERTKNLMQIKAPRLNQIRFQFVDY